MSIAQFCIDKKVVTYALSAAMLLAGGLAYTKLGRLEDPEFTIKNAQIITQYPGATALEVADEVTDEIETAVQKMGQLKEVTSTSYPGKSIVLVEMKDKYGKADLPQIWDELRRKVGDIQGRLPPGCEPSVVIDDFGDVYGVYYAIYGDGYSYAELKEYAKLLRRELLLCQDVAKVDLLGERPEVVYLEVSRAKLSQSGITPEMIQQVVQGQNQSAPSGRVEIGDKYIRIHPTGELKSVEALGDLMIALTDSASRTTIRLKDIATIRRDYQDPPQNIVRYNGKPSICLGLSTVPGGNVITMGSAIDKRMKELQRETPIGIEVGVISHQAQSVDVAIKGFIVNLIEAVIIVIAVLLFAMGMRSGILIGGVLILTVMSTIMLMQGMGIMFERISLGAFIIALGMLVDNAIVITEAVLIAAQRGENRVKAAVAIVEQTKWPLLGATIVAILSFAPIGASQDSTGEYCRSLFLVLAISLLMSWVLAITATPLFASSYLKSAEAGTTPEDPYAGSFFRGYRAFLAGCIRHRVLTSLVLAGMLAAAIIGFGKVKQNFFPESTRPQFMVHVWMPQGSTIEATDARISELDAYIRTLEGVTGSTAMTGTGGLRFLLTYTPEDPDASYGIIFVDVEDYKTITELADKVTAFARDKQPDVLVYTQRFVLGPGESQKIQMRILGPDPMVLRTLTDQALAVLNADLRLVEIQSDWRNRVDLIRPEIAEAKARNLGVTRADVAAALQRSYDGTPIGVFKEGDEALPIILRAPQVERGNPDALRSVWVWSKTLGRSIPIGQVVDRLVNTSEEACVGRRNRMLCVTVKCNTTGETAAEAFKRLSPQLNAIAAKFPSGYWREWGGEYEDTAKANAGLMSKIPPILGLMVLIVIMLFNSFRQPLVIFMTVPLALIGVTVGLLGFGQPFGFMALLGFLSLAGMQIKNAIVLIDEINAQKAAGIDDFNAVVNAGVTRLRPVAMAALTTVLGMLPLLVDAFYAAMAVTIMCGLTFATVLTMIVIPVNYAIVFKIPNPKRD
jgi:multidrug efflux pump subunit AcrB